MGQTVDEAAFLFYSLEQACQSQLLAEAAAANGVVKKIIPHDVAQFTADSVQTPVCSFEFLIDELDQADLEKNNFYLEFQPDFDLIVAESGGKVLQ